MLALQFPALHRMEVIQVPRPEVGPRELLLRVGSAGICGTDPHILHGMYPANLPLIPGHEYAGIVESAGSEVDGFKAGDRVTVDPNIVCGTCSYCRAGKVHLCKNLTALGVNIPGGFAEYSSVPAGQAFLLPNDFSLAHASLAEPVACCLRGMDLANVRSGDRVVIFGSGPMGAIMMQLAAMQGASAVIIVEPQAGRRRRAENLGASWTIDPAQDLPVEAIRSQYPDGVEVAFDCSGNVNAVKQCLEVVMRGGTVMMYGVCDKSQNIEVNPFWINDNEITIRGSYNNPNTMGRAVELLVSGRLNADAVVTHHFPLAKAEDAFRAIGSSETLKVVIDP